tara:strand:+ start:2100 stop:4307 length:2208 start_codon:yes stop_codon:yes gene_type:complete
MSSKQDNYEFSADIKQLMHLIINAFYSKKEIFLRELLSNASDAIDKIKYESLTNSESLGELSNLGIKITTDKINNRLIICDTGIGMTKKDLIDSLGTIAKSGTKSFMEALKDKNEDANLIGQFGVGFYSAYLVADTVEVITKNNDDKQYKWNSDSNGTFTILEDDGEPLIRGTKIILNLREDAKEYLEESKIKDLVNKHSQYISYPIELLVEREEEVTDDEEDIETEPEKLDTMDDSAPNIDEAVVEDIKTEPEKLDTMDDDAPNIDEAVVEDIEEDEEKETKPKKTIIKKEWEQLNKNKPLWLRKPDEITEEEYGEFYKSISNDWDSHAAQKHFSVEGNVEFNSLLFLPKKAPFDMMGGEKEKKYNKIKLYVRRVFIMDNCKDLMPEYLSFVVGIVDSVDLPLNVSREMIQQNKTLRIIRKQLVKKTITMISELSEKDDEYATFYNEFSKNLKLGIYEDSANREKLAKLLRYYTTSSKDKLTSIDDYIERMPEGQTSIYYLSGKNLKSIENSPFLESLIKKNYEVILMTDVIDEYMLQQLKEYDGKKLIDISKEELDLDETEEEKEELKNFESEYEELTKYIKEVLGEEVSKVTLTNRTVDTPCVLTSSKSGWSANMQRIMKAQAMGTNNPMNGYMVGHKVLEINPNNRTIKALNKRYIMEKDNETIKNLVWLLYETSKLNSGFTLDDPSSFTKRINKIIDMGLEVEEVVEDIHEQKEMDASDGVDEAEMEQVD